MQAPSKLCCLLPCIDEMTASGGLMILGIGFVILDITRPRVANFLPALVISPALIGGVNWFTAYRTID